MLFLAIPVLQQKKQNSLEQHVDASSVGGAEDERLAALEAERARLAAELDDTRARLLLAQAEAGAPRDLYILVLQRSLVVVALDKAIESARLST